jgi:structural maintenance of chromosomes protein 5
MHFFVGPRLNIVLGPNGTGKSALTHAICLACGGKPSSVGRSDDLKQFVKRDTEKHILSFCEVDLMRHNTVITIRRTLNDETQGSKWTIDSKPSTQKLVKEIMNEMNIDVDNLCSFMPQDKVGSFTQQSAKGILQKTLECIKLSGEKNLHEVQVELAAEQSNTRDSGREMETQKALVATLQQQLNGMKSEVERILQRAAVEQKLKLFEIRALGLRLQERSQAVAEKQALVDAVVKELASKKAEIQPLEVNA